MIYQPYDPTVLAEKAGMPVQLWIDLKDTALWRGSLMHYDTCCINWRVFPAGFRVAPLVGLRVFDHYTLEPLQDED